jgi:hypothetical protein
MKLESIIEKGKSLSSEIDAKRDELLKRDRELRELAGEIEGLAGQMAGLETQAAELGMLVSEFRDAVAVVHDDVGEEVDVPEPVAIAKPPRAPRAKKRASK